MQPWRIQPHQHVVPFRHLHKQPSETHLSFAQVDRRFERLQISFVRNSQHQDRCRCIKVGIWEHSVKDGPHTLKLQGRAETLFLAGVTDYNKIRRVYFQPSISLRARRSGQGGEQEHRREDSSGHCGAT